MGANAYVQLSRYDAFDDTAFWMLPSQSIESVADALVMAGYGSGTPDVDTLRIFDRPPFAFEAGYAAYMLWAASYLARAR